MHGSQEDLARLVESAVQLPTIPGTLATMQDVLSDPDAPLDKVARVLERDPPISATVLRLANSPIYGLPRPVCDIGQASTILGLRAIRSIVVQATVIDTLRRVDAGEWLDPQSLWDHSFKTATAARLIAQHDPDLFQLGPPEAYTAGLVHDLGKLVLIHETPDRFGAALRFSRQHNLPLHVAEEAEFGFNDFEVCAALLYRWRLGENMVAAVRRLPSTETLPGDLAKTSLVSAASALAHDVATLPRPWIPVAVGAELLERVGVEPRAIDRIRGAVRETHALS